MREITILVPLSFLIYVIGTSEEKGSIELPDAKRLAAWGLLFLVLVIFADFPETETLTLALTWLVAFTVFLTYGTRTVERVTSWVE